MSKRSEEETKAEGGKGGPCYEIVKMDYSEFAAEGKTPKERRNLEEIANKYYQQVSELTFNNLILNQKVRRVVFRCSN